MVHLKNLEAGIEDCSRARTYHNERFKRSAEAHGLVAQKVGNSGYANTSLSSKTRQLIESLNLDNFKIYRDLYGDVKERKKQSSIKYRCPACSTIIRATRKVNVRCDDCNRMFISSEV